MKAPRWGALTIADVGTLNGMLSFRKSRAEQLSLTDFCGMQKPFLSPGGMSGGDGFEALGAKQVTPCGMLEVRSAR
jgi:hypothetical protein